MCIRDSASLVARVAAVGFARKPGPRSSWGQQGLTVPSLGARGACRRLRRGSALRLPSPLESCARGLTSDP
eukprot:2438826-Alexandrium_andersonii.AAC.1